MARAILVLGGRISRGKTPPPNLKLRLDRAARLSRRNPGTPIIPTGGNTSWNKEKLNSGFDDTEAWAMREYLHQRGVTERIICEPLAEESMGNLIFSAVILKELGITEALIISQWCHFIRMAVLAHHIYKGVVTPTMVEVDCILKAKCQQSIKVDCTTGKEFVDRFLKETTAGDLEGMYEWVKQNHQGGPYRGITWADREEQLLSQVYSLWSFFVPSGLINLEQSFPQRFLF